MLRRFTTLFVVVLFLAQPIPAWNSAGHRIIAAIAYDQLTPSARARVDELIRRHPDYQTVFLKDAPSDPARHARHAFIAASVWADIIKSDPRFYDNERPNAQPTPTLPGFPDMGRHQSWHYVDFPITQDGTRTVDPRPPHILSEIERLTPTLTRSTAQDAAYALPWLLHLVGDLHNPLHTVQRFSRDLPDGDKGGNSVVLRNNQNLHLFWDNLPGPSSAKDDFVDSQAKAIFRQNRPTGSVGVNPMNWAKEGVEIAKTGVYTFGPSSGSPAHPLRLSATYQNTAKQLYKKRLSLAGTRLADLLNRQS